jgi:hypothetical protein
LARKWLSPVANDQPGVAARIAYTKTGAFVRLSLLIDEVVRNPEYRKNANALRQAIANTNGLEKAVDLLEAALGLQRPLEQKVGLRAQAAIIQEALLTISRTTERGV